MHIRQPAGGLGSHVLNYEGYTSDTRHSRHTQTPHGGIVVIISPESPLKVIDPRLGETSVRPQPAFVAGLHDGPVITEDGGVTRGMQVNFTPIGARLFFGVPMDTLANTHIALEDALGTDGRRLIEQMSDGSDWESKFRILDDTIARRIQQAAPVSEGTAWAWHQIQDSGGQRSIGWLTQQLGWSRKRMAAEFRDHIGLPPKQLARIVRFNRAARCVTAERPVRWTEIAMRCGYYDQAHFNRDFRQFAGATPSEYLQRLLPEGGGVLSD